MNDLWTMHPRYGEIHAGGELVARFNPDGEERGLWITSDGVEGWDTLPDAKVTGVERGQGDGAHDVPDTDILYAARTVTIHYQAIGYDRADLLDVMRRINRLAHQSIRLRLVDGREDTYVDGYLASMGRSGGWHPLIETGLTMHVVCPRPERLSWAPHRAQLLPTRDGNGGLSYGADGAGFEYPVTYGRAASDARNTCLLVNDGTSRAYPVFTVYGDFPDGVDLQCSGGLSVRYDEPVTGAPVILDARTGTATLGGRDVSRALSSRGWPEVDPGGSLTVALQSSGTGWVDCLIHDTYM